MSCSSLVVWVAVVVDVVFVNGYLLVVSCFVVKVVQLLLSKTTRQQAKTRAS